MAAPPTPALDEATHRYRAAIRKHRGRQRLLEVCGMVAAAEGERDIVELLERGLNREIANPPVIR